MAEAKQPPYFEQPPPPYDPAGQYGGGYGQTTATATTYSYSPGFQQPTMVKVQPTATIVTQTIILPIEMGGESRRMTCPHCGADIQTRVNYKDGRMTHIAALLLCLFGFYCCCCFPYCMDSCKDADHECPNCNRHIGSYRR